MEQPPLVKIDGSILATIGPNTGMVSANVIHPTEHIIEQNKIIIRNITMNKSAGIFYIYSSNTK
jgi:hypothetical protein